MIVVPTQILLNCVILALSWDTVRQRNAEGVHTEYSKRHTIEQEKALSLIMQSFGQSATQIFKKLDRRFPHGVGRLHRYLLEDEASAQDRVLGDFPDYSGVTTDAAASTLVLGSKMQTCWRT